MKYIYNNRPDINLFLIILEENIILKFLNI